MIQLKLNENIINYDREIDLDKICADIFEYAKGHDLIIDYMDIDSAIIYDDYEGYIKDNIDTINRIDVHFLTKEELFKNILSSTSQYIFSALPIIDNIANDFYLGAKDNESIDGLSQLLEGLSWILSTSSNINQSYNFFDRVAWSDFYSLTKSLENNISDLNEAIMNMDNVLIADILKYEISERFSDMYDALQQLIPGKLDANPQKCN